MHCTLIKWFLHCAAAAVCVAMRRVCVGMRFQCRCNHMIVCVCVLCCHKYVVDCVAWCVSSTRPLIFNFDYGFGPSILRIPKSIRNSSATMMMWWCLDLRRMTMALAKKSKQEIKHFFCTTRRDQPSTANKPTSERTDDNLSHRCALRMPKTLENKFVIFPFVNILWVDACVRVRVRVNEWIVFGEREGEQRHRNVNIVLLTLENFVLTCSCFSYSFSARRLAHHEYNFPHCLRCVTSVCACAMHCRCRNGKIRSTRVRRWRNVEYRIDATFPYSPSGQQFNVESFSLNVSMSFNVNRICWLSAVAVQTKFCIVAYRWIWWIVRRHSSTKFIEVKNERMKSTNSNDLLDIGLKWKKYGFRWIKLTYVMGCESEKISYFNSAFDLCIWFSGGEVNRWNASSLNTLPRIQSIPEITK